MRHSRRRRRSRYRQRRVISWVLLWILMLSVSFGLVSVFVLHFLGGNSAISVTSLDWAGYSVSSDVADPKPVVTGVSGSWVVPEVTISQEDAFSAVWIGIGGQSDQTLIQTGTEQDSVGGEAVYFAWYEVLPDFAVMISELNVSSGDVISASIGLVESAADMWLVSIIDESTGQRFEKTVVYMSSRLSAEWIVERPTVNNNMIGRLADFSSVTFTNLRTTVDGVTATMNSFPFSRVEMVNRQNDGLASVSAFSPKTESFSVSFLASG